MGLTGELIETVKKHREKKKEQKKNGTYVHKYVREIGAIGLILVLPIYLIAGGGAFMPSGG